MLLASCNDGAKPVIQPAIDTFCLTNKPWRPTHEQLAATPIAEQRQRLVDNRDGAKRCGWAP